MRVLQVYRTYFPDPQGGLQEAIRQIALATQPFGVETRIFTLSPTPHPAVLQRPEGGVVRSRSWAAPASCDLGGPDAFARFAEQVRWADIVHYQFPWPFADLLHLLTRVRKPTLMTYVSDIVRQRALGTVYAPLMRRMLRSMDLVVTTSPAYARTSPVLASLAPERLRVVPLGIVEESYRDAIEGARGIDLTGRVQAPYFLAIGVLRYYKGLHFLVEAAAITGLRVVIAGDGPERAALESRARELRAPVVFLGHVDDAEKMALLRDCQALVLPSHLRSEAFGMVLLEAAMTSRPAISCEIGTGTSFVNLHGETGLVVPPADPAALAEAMRTLAGDPQLRERFGAGARARYESVFAGPALGRDYTALYQELLQ